jgi:hypothetical protein
MRKKKITLRADRCVNGMYRVLIVALLGAIVLWMVASLHRQAMMRAYKYNAYITLREAHEHFARYGTITSPSSHAEIFYYSNRFVIDHDVYECVLGMLWGHPDVRRSLLGVTADGVILWLDDTNRPKIMEFN